MFNTICIFPVAFPPSTVWIVLLYNLNVACLQWATSNCPTQKKSTRKTRRMYWNDIFRQDSGDEKGNSSACCQRQILLWL